MSDHNKLIYLGVITGVNGLRGYVKVKSFASKPENLGLLPLQDESGNKIKLKIIKVAKDHVVCSVEGISDRDAAESARGLKLYTKRCELADPEPAEYYIEDLRGLEVRSSNGEVVGKIIQVHNFGAGDIIEIEYSEGKSEMYLFTSTSFSEVTKDYVVFERPESI